MKIAQQSWQDRSHQAFSMLEVMIAIGIFFTSVFVILQLTSQQLRMARSLQTLDVDTGTLPSLIVMTNALEEGPLPMEIKVAFEDTNPGFSCDGMVHEYATNGLFIGNKRDGLSRLGIVFSCGARHQVEERLDCADENLHSKAV